MTTITTTYTSPGSGTWLCPSGVTSVKAECWGAGGGGANGAYTGAYNGGGGGGSGEYAGETTVAVTPGKYYRWTVGSGGLSGGGDGGQSVFAGDTLIVTANGGYGAPPVSGSSSPGGTAGSGSTNGLEHPGAAGGNGANEAGGGGASSGGTSAGGNAGGNASGFVGGTGGAAVTGGGAGGNGGGYGASGQAGGNPGGGGGGGPYEYFGQAGGPGGAGKVALTYTASIQPQVPQFPAGYAPLPSDFNGWIQAPMAFLTSKVVFSAELTTGTTLTNGTGVVLPFNSSIYDPFGGWNGTSYEWLCPAGYSGTYEVTVTVSSASNSDTTSAVQAVVAVDGTALEYAVGKSAVPSNSSAIASGSMLVQLYGGVDYVQGLGFFAASSGNSSVITTAGQRCQMAITWVSL